MKRYIRTFVNNGSFSISESMTGITIKDDIPAAESKTLTSFLNGGGGFNGWTPEFFMGKLKVN